MVLTGLGTPVAERYCGDDVMCCRDGSAVSLDQGLGSHGWANWFGGVGWVD